MTEGRCFQLEIEAQAQIDPTEMKHLQLQMEIPVQLQIVRMMIYEEAIVEGLAPEDMSMTIALVKLETEIPVMKEAVAMEGEATVVMEGGKGTLTLHGGGKQTWIHPQ